MPTSESRARAQKFLAAHDGNRFADTQDFLSDGLAILFDAVREEAYKKGYEDGTCGPSAAPQETSAADECLCDPEWNGLCPEHGWGTVHWQIEQFEAWWFSKGKEIQTTKSRMCRLAWLAASKAMKEVLNDANG